MAIQDQYGRIGFFEHFNGIAAAATIADATAGTRYNDVVLIAISGDVAMTYTVDESGGVVGFSGAAGAGDGITLTSAPMQPSTNGVLVAGGRFKVSAATDYQAFVGWQETVSLSETVIPFTLSGSTLTANAAGSCVGFYYDTTATADGWRFMAGDGGVASTSGGLDQARTAATTLGALGVLAGETLTADTWMVWRVEIDPNGAVRGYFGDETMANSLSLTLVASLKAGVIDQAALHYPIMTLLEASTGDPTHEVDYFFAKGNMDWAA